MNKRRPKQPEKCLASDHDPGETVTIATNISMIQQRISQANLHAGHDGAVTLVAVSKKKPASDIRQCAAAGVNHVGESYLQEALEKLSQLRDLPLQWHFIGRLQTNKCKIIAREFDWIQSVDRKECAELLSRHRPPQLPRLNALIQVNPDGEVSKGGVPPAQARALAGVITALPNLCLRGIMSIPRPAEQQVRKQAFEQVAALYLELRELFPSMDTLSLGMSDDLELAIAAGGNMVRVGTAIFGER